MKSKQSTENLTFAQKHPRINLMIGIVLVVIILALAIFISYYVFFFLGK